MRAVSSLRASGLNAKLNPLSYLKRKPTCTTYALVRDLERTNGAADSLVCHAERHNRTRADLTTHLGRYTAEFDLRYNTRAMNDGERAALMLKGAEGRRLTYRRTDRLAA